MKHRGSLDKTGRIHLPKALRDSMHLKPGSDFLIESAGERITLRPLRPQASLKKEYGVWVYQGAPSNQPIPDLINRGREKRARELRG
jgi:AbrB family looped-hinge helix DNA binding protein